MSRNVKYVKQTFFTLEKATYLGFVFSWNSNMDFSRRTASIVESFAFLSNEVFAEVVKVQMHPGVKRGIVQGCRQIKLSTLQDFIASTPLLGSWFSQLSINVPDVNRASCSFFPLHLTLSFGSLCFQYIGLARMFLCCLHCTSVSSSFPGSHPWIMAILLWQRIVLSPSIQTVWLAFSSN